MSRYGVVSDLIYRLVCRREIRERQQRMRLFISALVRSIAKPHDPFLAAPQELADAATSGRQPSTQEQNLAQPSHDHRPDEGSRA